MDSEDLRKEQEVFVTHIDEWRRDHLGEFVLIHRRDVLGFFTTLTQAFDKGIALYGLGPFFVRQILPADPVNVSFLGERLLST